MGKGILIGLVVFIVLENILGAFFLISYFNLTSSYGEMGRELSNLRSLRLKLEEDYQSLNATYWALSGRYSDLQAAYGSIVGNYSLLEATYRNLAVNHSLLEFRYGELEGLYESLVWNYSVLEWNLKVEEVLKIGNSLQSYYDLVRQRKGLAGTEGSTNPLRDQAIFAAELASHDLGNPYLKDVEAEFEKIMGERSYEIAKSKIVEVLVLIGVKEDDPLVVRVGKILNFTGRYIRYELELNNIYRAPVETLGLRSGDCDDYTILVAALFEAVGIDSAVGSFKNATEAYHYMVLVHLNDLPGYKYRIFPNLTKFGLSEGKWILIEPQLQLEHQGDEWVWQWILLAAAEV